MRQVEGTVVVKVVAHEHLHTDNVSSAALEGGPHRQVQKVGARTSLIGAVGAAHFRFGWLEIIPATE